MLLKEFLIIIIIVIISEYFQKSRKWRESSLRIGLYPLNSPEMNLWGFCFVIMYRN